MKRSSMAVERERLYTLLRKFRQDKGIRQVELAERLGVPQSFISKYESGERRLDILELRQVCGALGIPLEEVIRKLEDTLDEAQ